MADGTYTQTVPQALLEKKLGRKLELGEDFETSVGRWRIIALCRDGNDTYTVERMS